jgi:hypothetical protein
MLKRWRRGRGEDEDNDDGKPVGYNQEEKTVPPPSPEMGNKSAKRGTDMRPIMGYTPAAETAKKRSQSSKPRMSHKRTSTHGCEFVRMLHRLKKPIQTQTVF